MTLRAAFPSAFLLLITLTTLPLQKLEAATVTHGPTCTLYEQVKPRFFVRADPQSAAEDASVLVRVGIYRNASFTDSVKATANAIADQSHDYTVILDGSGSPALSYNTTYYYRVFLNNASTAFLGQFKTFRSSTDPTAFRFAMMSDLQDAQRRSLQDAPSYTRVRGANPNFVLLAGDFDHRGPKTLPERRAMYRDVLSGSTAGNAFRDNIRPYFPIYYIWDNHDFGSPDKYFADSEGDNFDYRCQAWESFREYWPTPPLPNPPPLPSSSACTTAVADGGYWYKFGYGEAHFFVLDVRSQKDPATRNSSNPTMLGPTQLAWLKSELLASTETQARWIFLITTVSFDSLVKANTSVTDPLLPGTPSGWGTFVRERNEIAKFLADNGICNAIWLSGDLHSGGSADSIHTGWKIDDLENGNGAPEFGAPHVNLANDPQLIECTSDPDQGDSGLLRTGASDGRCTVDTTLGHNITGEWSWNGVPTYVSGYNAAEDAPHKPLGDQYPNGGHGGAGYMLVDVSYNSVTVLMYDKEGTLQTTGVRPMQFTLNYSVLCPRPPDPPPDPDQP